MDDELLLKKRLNELSSRAYMKGYNTFSDFLNIDEISVLKSLKLDSKVALYGGYDNATRCIGGFGDEIEQYEFPIQCIKISPIQQKFADELTHRDFLGALMNLGINRNTLGDIVLKNNEGYLFCLNTISEYIIDNLDRIKHTSVKCECIDYTPDFMNELPDASEILVSSLRADAVIACIYNLSRNSVAELFNKEKVFINSKVALKDSVSLKNNDIISVRGYGKFIYCKIARQTKKGRLAIEVRIYK